MGGPGSGPKKGSVRGPRSVNSKMFVGSTPGSRARIQVEWNRGKAISGGKIAAWKIKKNKEKLVKWKAGLAKKKK